MNVNPPYLTHPFLKYKILNQYHHKTDVIPFCVLAYLKTNVSVEVKSLENVRENRSGNQEWTMQRKPEWQSRMDNSETLATLGPRNKAKQQTKHNKTQHRKLKRRTTRTL